MDSVHRRNTPASGLGLEKKRLSFDFSRFGPQFSVENYAILQCARQMFQFDDADSRVGNDVLHVDHMDELLHVVEEVVRRRDD